MLRKNRWIYFLLVIALTACSVPLHVSPTATATLAPTGTSTNITPPLVITPQLTSVITAVPDATAVAVTVNRISDADAALLAGDYSTALQLYQQAVSSSNTPDLKAAAQYGVGQVQWLQNDSTSALDSFRSLTDQYANTLAGARGYYFLGQIYNSLQRYADAAAAYQAYLKARPGVIDAYIYECMGDALAANKDYQAANQAYQSAEAAPQLGDNESLEIKIGQNLVLMNNLADAITAFSTIYQKTTNEYTKAEMDLLLGQVETTLGNTTQAYTYFQDAVSNYPSSMDSYQALVGLLDANQTVDDLNRGLVDYFAAQYDAADQAFTRYLANADSKDKGTAYYYEGLTQRSLGEAKYPLGSDARNTLAAQNQLTEDNQAIADWQNVTLNYLENKHWSDAWDDIAYTQWAYLNQPEKAAETVLSEVAARPTSSSVPDLLFSAARYYERANDLDKAAQTWASIADQFPNSDQTSDGLFFAGISYYRLGKFSNAQSAFQRNLLLATDASDKARALFWTGKAEAAQNNTTAAKTTWQEATDTDPTGYYSDRARDLLAGKTTITTTSTLDFSYDLNAEKTQAEAWMIKTFSLAQNTDLLGMGPLSSDVRLVCGEEFWSLGLKNDALNEFQSLQNAVNTDAVSLFRLVSFYLDIGFYQQAILASRQILNLAGMTDATSLTAPAFFNHIRFGIYYKDQVQAAAKSESIDPILIYSVMRQESLFEGFVQSSAGAVGLMQLMPDTAQSIVTNMGWPDNYTSDDLIRPVINIPLGAHYLEQYSDYLNHNLYAMLASYNAGPGNALAWENLANGDLDLYLEVVRVQQTRNYIQGIVENYDIYQQIYSTGP